MSKQHTPYRFDPEWFQIVDSKNNVIADYVNEDKAELILKAVNNHDRLVDMVKKLLPYASYEGSERKEALELLTELKV